MGLFIEHLIVSFDRWNFFFCRFQSCKLYDVDDVSDFDELKFIHFCSKIKASAELDQVGFLVSINLIRLVEKLAVDDGIKCSLDGKVESLSASLHHQSSLKT